MAYYKAILDNYCDTTLCGHRAEYRVFDRNNTLIGIHCHKHAIQVYRAQQERETALKAGGE